MQARGREEWESALLQNANTKCNGLLPLWGPGVTESAFAACLARYTYNISLSVVPKKALHVGHFSLSQ